jgi:uncharacterized membrane protein YjgN (DUF898 family)
MDTSRQNLSEPALFLEFTGEAGEYFRIWIVNVCLTLVTLGLYAPWAKVRTKRYFYGSTRLAGAAFDYTANPVAILKGRLIAAAIVLVFALVSHFLPIAQALFAFAFILALPWLIVRTQRFNALNSLHRNIRFDFRATYGEALVNFVLLPILIPLSLGLAYPWIVRRQKKFLADHAAYGAQSFLLEATTKDFWIIFFKLGLFVIVGIVAGIILISATGKFFIFGLDGPPQPDTLATDMIRLVILLYLPLLALMFSAGVYVNTALSNLIWNHIRLGAIRFQSNLAFSKMLGLYLSNLLAIVFSLGLLIPWAKIRMARYRLECLGLCCRESDLNAFAAGQSRQVSAFGEELSDLLDVDIGL